MQGYKHTKAYIIAEGPMASTARNMWKVIHDRKCGAIVMLSDLVENGMVHGIWVAVAIAIYLIDGHFIGEQLPILACY